MQRRATLLDHQEREGLLLRANAGLLWTDGIPENTGRLSYPADSKALLFFRAVAYVLTFAR